MDHNRVAVAVALHFQAFAPRQVVCIQPVVAVVVVRDYADLVPPEEYFRVFRNLGRERVILRFHGYGVVFFAVEAARYLRGDAVAQHDILRSFALSLGEGVGAELICPDVIL